VNDKNAETPDLLVELADATLRVSRKLRGYPLQNPEVVPLSPLECLVLLHVHERPGLSPSDLAHELALRSSNAATALRGLVEKGQVERKPDPADKRAAHLYLTPLAAQSIETVRRTWHELLAPANIPVEDLRVAVRVLATIDATIVEP